MDVALSGRDTGPVALETLRDQALAGVDHHFATIDGLRIHYAEAGTGEPLILLHGWPQHWWEWRHLIGPLSQRYRVICPDVRGLGWSEGSQAGYGFERLARDVVDLMDTLDIPRARLIGRDWGLVTGYRACLNWPDRFEQFVAMAGVHPWTWHGASLPVFTRPWHIYLLAALGRSTPLRLSMTERCLRVWRHQGHFTPWEREVYLSAMRTSAAETATIRFNRAVISREVPEVVRHYRMLRLRVPTLHLNGARDPLSVGIPDTYGDYADDMRLELVPDCGHFIPEEQPDWLLERLLAFFAT